MMRKFLTFAMAASLTGLAWLSAGPAFAQQATRSRLHDAATGKLKPAELPLLSGAPTLTGANIPRTRVLPFISDGMLEAAREAIRKESAGTHLADPTSSPGTLGCGDRTSDGNKRVNQDCTFRGQAEEGITFNPADPTNLLAGANDHRVGFNQCSIAFSTDNGAKWGDMLPPFRSKINYPAFQLPTASDPNQHTIAGDPGTLHTYDASSDPGVAFDSQGRGFFSCVAFDLFDAGAMLYVAQSPLGAQGSYFRNIDTFSRSFVVVEDNNFNIVHDKPFITADTFSGSPNQDNVYATWTVFKFGCGPSGGFCSNAIFGSMSTDHGLTWSTPQEISGNSPTLCFFGDFFDKTRNPHDCDFDQGSDPAVLSSGDLVVVFNNGNTPAGNPNGQQLAVHCSPSGSSPDGSANLNCGTPTKVGDDIVVGEPLCNFGRGPEECVPGPWIRTNDFPRIALSHSDGHLFSAWQDYRNGEYDIQLATSTDGGATWASSTTVNPDTGLDHYFAAVSVAPDAGPDRVGVSYYRSGRVPNENTTPAGGFAPGQPGVQQEPSDYVLGGGTGTATPFDFKVLSPVFAPPDGIQAGFNGDYSGLTVSHGAVAHPIWSDTRNVDPLAPINGVTHDEDVFTDTAGLPNGKAKTGVGQIGQR